MHLEMSSAYYSKPSAANNCITLLTNVCIEANSVDPDQTAPEEAVCFGSTLSKSPLEHFSRRQNRQLYLLWLTHYGLILVILITFASSLDPDQAPAYYPCYNSAIHLDGDGGRGYQWLHERFQKKLFSTLLLTLTVWSIVSPLNSIK